MRFPYLTADPSQSELDSLPRLPLTLRYGQQKIAEVGLVDSGATVNVLSYGLGVRLGAVWDDRKATIRLAGNLLKNDGSKRYKRKYINKINGLHKNETTDKKGDSQRF